MYYKEKQPIKAEIKVSDSANSETPLYSENITLTTERSLNTPFLLFFKETIEDIKN